MYKFVTSIRGATEYQMRTTFTHIIRAITFILSMIAVTCNAQFTSAEFGVDGLTCSACSRSVEMGIRKLGFVKDVQMDINNTKGVVTFKDSSKISIEKIAKAIIDAGFSVRYMKATFMTDTIIHASDNYCFVYNDATYQFVKMTPTELKKDVALTFIGREFLPPKEYKKWKADLKPAGSCVKGFIYYITL